MCLAIPGKVLDIENDRATIDVGGVIRAASTVLVPQLKMGDYVLVHTGFAIEIIDEDEALKTLELFREIIELETGANEA